MTLQRHLGTWSLLFTALGGILGSGWLLGPYITAQVAGPAAVVSWVLGGSMMTIIAITFAELSSTFPVTGGSVRFLQLSHGPLASFTMAWIGWLSSAAVGPIETLAILQYANNYIPGLMHKVEHVYVLSHMGMLVAAGVLLLMCGINVYGVKFLARANNSVVVVKIVAPVVTAIVLLFGAFHLNNFTAPSFAPFGLKGIVHALPIAGVVFSFMGFSAAVQLAGEVKNPQRSLPIALIGAMLISLVIYVVLQIAFVGVLNPGDFALGWSHLGFSGDAGPFAGIAIALGVAWLSYLLYVGAIVAPFGTGLVFSASTARLVYAMGENGYLPKFLEKLNRHGVPGRIILVNFLVGLLLFLPFPSWRSMVGFLVSAFVFTYAVGPLALIVLRKTMPKQPRPFRIPAARIMCLLAFYFCNLIVYWTGWAIVSKMLVAMLIGYVVLGLFKLSARGKALALEWHKALWMIAYLIMLGLISYLGPFGGGAGVVEFGLDFILIAAMSFLIYEAAIHSVPHAEDA